MTNKNLNNNGRYSKKTEGKNENKQKNTHTVDPGRTREQQRTNESTLTAKAVLYYKRMVPLDACK